MSKITLQPGSAGSGTFSIVSPDSNNNRDLTLPDSTGELLTKDSLNATGTAPIYACRAWVNFDGTNNNIRASGNVSSITDNGAGDYTVNFTTALPDGNASAVCAAQRNNAGANGDIASLKTLNGTNAIQSSSVRIFTGLPSVSGISDNPSDAGVVTVAVFR